MFSFPSLLHLTIVFVNTELLETVTKQNLLQTVSLYISQAIQIHFYVFMFGDCRLIHFIKLQVLSNVIIVNLMKEYTEEQEQKAHH